MHGVLGAYDVDLAFLVVFDFPAFQDSLVSVECRQFRCRPESDFSGIFKELKIGEEILCHMSEVQCSESCEGAQYVVNRIGIQCGVNSRSDSAACDCGSGSDAKPESY